MIRTTLRALLFAGLLAPHAVLAQPIQVEQPWARATAPQQKMGGAYVTLTAPAGDRLLGARSPVASRVELHELRTEGDVKRMRELADGLALPAGQAVAMSPGGYHLMLVDLKQPLVAGRAIPLQLRFRDAPPVEVQLQVAPVGAAGPSAKLGHIH